MNTATLIEANLKGFTGNASLYELDPPLIDVVDGTISSISLVIVSGVDCAFDTGSPETFIFEANVGGRPQPKNWRDLPGSFRGANDHARALANAGYAIAVNAAVHVKSLPMLPEKTP